MKLLWEALVKFTCGLLLVGLLLFLPAGTFAYPYGWLLIGLLFVPMLIAGLVMLAKSPEFLKKRLDAKEKQGKQKGVVAFSGLMFIAGFVVAGLDFRFGWSTMPLWVVIAASVLFLVAYCLYAEVMRENAYLSRTIKVEEGQRVVDTGLYGIVRHPMYAVTILMFLMIPLVLGSWYALIVFVFYPAII
ncbi:MAG: isoprenylcysteine carboxylmethyltransferase family protein, partial [Oscillospiraceae bacterium]|nr:isoprenylcysteine carboxylmethyltransferase family protein [Oscillospiraceae bacterium]